MVTSNLTAETVYKTKKTDQTFSDDTLASEGGKQMETHNMDDFTEDIFNNVNHLIECQRFVVERVEFLETKRLEITNMIRSLSDPNHKETLENQLNKMEMKVSITCVTDKVHNRVVVIDDCLDMIKNIKCRYNDRGYCRSQSDCVFFHAENVCDKVLSNGKCTESKKCLLRWEILGDA